MEYLQSGNPGMVSEFFDKKLSKCVEKLKFIILIVNIIFFVFNVITVTKLKTSLNHPQVLKKSNPI